MSLALPDHYLTSLPKDGSETIPALDGLAQLAGLARETDRIQLSVMVSPITFRHPAVIGKMAVTIDHMSSGRFALGVGTGWLEAEHRVFGLEFFDRVTRFEMLEECLGYLRAMFDPGPVGFQGTHFALEAVEIAPAPLGDLPIVIGGVGKTKTPVLAGRFADEYNCYPAPDDEFAARIDRMRAAALSAGRDPDQIMVSSSGAVVAAASRQDYGEKVAAMAADAGVTQDQLEAHWEYRQTPRGTYEEVAEILDGLSALGVQRFYLQRAADFDRVETDLLLKRLGG